MSSRDFPLLINPPISNYNPLISINKPHGRPTNFRLLAAVLGRYSTLGAANHSESLFAIGLKLGNFNRQSTEPLLLVRILYDRVLRERKATLYEVLRTLYNRQVFMSPQNPSSKKVYAAAKKNGSFVAPSRDVCL